MYKRRELDTVELSDTMMRIIGEIEPTGSHEVDEQRLQNLYKLCATIDCLMDEIMDLLPYKDRTEYSMKEIGECASRWLVDKSVWIGDAFEEQKVTITYPVLDQETANTMLAKRVLNNQ